MNILNQSKNLVNNVTMKVRVATFILSGCKNFMHVSDYLAKAQTIAELSQLSDYQLADMGLQRQQLNRQLSKMWNDDTKVASVVAAKPKPKTTAQSHKPGFNFGQLIVAAYSRWNRTGYVV